VHVWVFLRIWARSDGANRQPQLALLLHGAYATVIYFYVTAEAKPLPRGVINKTHRDFLAFQKFKLVLYVRAEAPTETC